jgi:transposase
MEEGSKGRRRHSTEFKREVLGKCEAPGASVAAVALAHGINANLVHKWRRQARPAERGGASFIPVKLRELEPPATADGSGCIEIQLRRGGTAVQVRWPVSAASGCADWLRAWLG